MLGLLALESGMIATQKLSMQHLRPPIRHFGTQALATS
jgi:hypothetical protein